MIRRENTGGIAFELWTSKDLPQAERESGGISSILEAAISCASTKFVGKGGGLDPRLLDHSDLCCLLPARLK